MGIKRTFRWLSKKSGRVIKDKKVGWRHGQKSEPVKPEKKMEADFDRDEAFILDESYMYEPLGEDKIDEADKNTTHENQVHTEPGQHREHVAKRPILHLPENPQRKRLKNKPNIIEELHNHNIHSSNSDHLGDPDTATLHSSKVVDTREKTTGSTSTSVSQLGESEQFDLLDTHIEEDIDLLDEDISEDIIEEAGDFAYQDENNNNREDTHTETEVSPYLRACQLSLAFIRKNGWSDAYLFPLAEVLNTRGYGTILSHFQGYADQGMTPDEFLLASQLREFWSNNRFLWVSFTSSEKMSRFTQKNLSWAQCLRIIEIFTESSGFSPAFEEIENYLLDLFDRWYSSNILRTTYGSFSAFLHASIISSDSRIEAGMQVSWEDSGEEKELFYNDPYDITNRQEQEFYDMIGQPVDLERGTLLIEESGVRSIDENPMNTDDKKQFAP